MRNFFARLCIFSLILVLGVSLFELVAIRYQQRILNTQIIKARVEADNLDRTWGHLLFERSQASSSLFLTKEIKQRLKLFIPDSSDILYIPLSQ